MIYTIDNKISINDSLKKLNDGDTLFLKNGIYVEKVIVFNKNIIIEGESQDNVIITNHDWYTKIMPDFNECNTFRTYTLLVIGDNVKISNLTIENSSIPSSKYGQAVALYVDGNNFYASNVSLKSAQDTLLTGPIPKDLMERYKGFLPEYQLEDKKSNQIYENCKIYGDVDFIFGCAQALFINSDIISIKRENAKDKTGYISAPAHPKDDKYGYLFYNCNMISEDNENDGAIYLSRPWRDYGTAAFINCKYSNHISKLGFNKWNNTNRDKTARYYEYNESDLSNREKWVTILNKTEADNYVKEFFDIVGYKK